MAGSRGKRAASGRAPDARAARGYRASCTAPTSFSLPRTRSGGGGGGGGGNLEPWARQGVLLLNTVLTVQAGASNSHAGRGWERLTDAIVREVSRSSPRCVFILWGKPAQEKKKLVDQARHLVLEAPHPSPLSAHRGFFGSRPFSKTNSWLAKHGLAPIDWRL